MFESWRGHHQFVSRLPNSIGYVEYAYVKQNKMIYTMVQNSAGNWINPSDDAFKAAVAGADWTKTYYQILTNQNGKESWPITGATFILIHLKPLKPEDIKSALKFFDWAYASGDKATDDLDYVPLPDPVKNHIRADWTRLGLK